MRIGSESAFARRARRVASPSEMLGCTSGSQQGSPTGRFCFGASVRSTDIDVISSRFRRSRLKASASMDRSLTWERIGAGAGLAFVALILASFLVIPDAPPALDDPIGKIRAYYVDNASSFQASMFLTGLAGFFFLGFLGTLSTTLSRADPGGWLHRVVFPAGAVVLSVVFVSAGVTDALATRVAAESDQAVIRALYDVQAFTITFTAFPIAALVGAVSVVSRR